MAKKKQSKGSWRKRGAPLEAAALEARRIANQEVRTGGSLAGLNDDQLFELQPAAPDKPKAAIGHRTRKTGGRSNKPLRTELAVAPNPHVPAVVKPPIAKKRSTPSRHALIVKSKIARVANGLVQHRAQRSLADAGAPAALPDPLDLWHEKSSSQPLARRHPRHLPESSTVVSAVTIPEEGASWNPTEEAHQKLLEKATTHELERLRRERVHRFALIPHSDDEDDAEGDSGRSAANNTASNEELEEEHQEVGTSWHVDRPKVTKVQRNRRDRAKVREQAEREAKLERKREKQLGRLGSIMHEIQRDSYALATRKQEEEDWLAKRPKKLAGKRYAPPRPDVLLSDEQPSALRQLASEGSLLADRFDSLQARNMIEQRDKQPRRSHKRSRRVIPAENSKALRYKSPFYKGPLPAWM